MTKSITQTLLEFWEALTLNTSLRSLFWWLTTLSLSKEPFLMSCLNFPWHRVIPFPYDLSLLTRRDQQLPRHRPVGVSPQPSLPSSWANQVTSDIPWKSCPRGPQIFPSNQSENRALTVLYFLNSVCQKSKSYSLPHGCKESLVFSFFRGANLPKRSVFLTLMKDSNWISLTQ